MADAISCLPILTEVNPEITPARFLTKLPFNEDLEHHEQMSIEDCSEYMSIEEDPDWNPITYQTLYFEQTKDVLLKNSLTSLQMPLSCKF